MVEYNNKKKSLLVVLILGFLFCGLGAHRFYLKQVHHGFLILLLFAINVTIINITKDPQNAFSVLFSFGVLADFVWACFQVKSINAKIAESIDGGTKA